MLCNPRPLETKKVIIKSESCLSSGKNIYAVEIAEDTLL